MPATSTNHLRIDRWLWFARFYKSRSLASAAVVGGHVRINGERAKPGSRVGDGDVIEILRDRLPYKVTAGPVPRRRGPAAEAAACYIEDEATRDARDAMSESLRQDRQQMPRTAGRPDKRTRRLLRERIRGDSD